MSKFAWRGTGAFLAIVVLAFLLMGMGYGKLNAPTSTQAADTTLVADIVALPGYHVSLFATGGTAYSSPDSVVVDGNYIYIGYQNKSVPDGSNGKSSTIVMYNWHGDVVHTFSIVGHCDGLRVDPSTHLLWATVNEDASAALYIINPWKDTMVT